MRKMLILGIILLVISYLFFLIQYFEVLNSFWRLNDYYKDMVRALEQFSGLRPGVVQIYISHVWLYISVLIFLIALAMIIISSRKNI